MKNLFVGAYLFSIGEKEKGIEAVETNLLFKSETEISTVVLEKMQQGTLDVSALPEEIASAIRYDTDFEQLLIRAQNGDTDAQFEVGRRYWNGEGVRENDNAAFSWFEKAALKGYPLALFMLGRCYYHGLGGASKDYKKAEMWLDAAVKGGVNEARELLTRAQFKVGEQCYRNTSYRDAAKYFELAAQQGDHRAQARMGIMYARGRGVVANKYKSIEWFQKAAAQGNKIALKGLKEMQEDGKLSEKDDGAEGAVIGLIAGIGIGAVIGQMLIPIPFLGGLIGGVVGFFIGTATGITIDEEPDPYLNYE